jgi:hypothetical protein
MKRNHAQLLRRRRKPAIPVPAEVVESRIFNVRGHRVMLDSDLAGLYGVTTFNLNKAVKRNITRFPPDFMFQLIDEEAQSLRFQIGISKTRGRGGRRYLPYAFTEEGVAMLSSVLRSERAVQVNVVIMRAFVRLREVMITHKALAQKIEALEKRYDGQFKTVFDAIRRLMETSAPRRRQIGFTGGRQI